MEVNSISEHVREHRSLLADVEKKALVGIAQRLPAWVNSDHLTFLGFIAMIGAGTAFWIARWHKPALLLVVVALALNWFGDSLDGTVAWVRNRQRPRYGFYVDHVLDIAGALFLLGGLSLSGYISPFVAVGLLAGFAMVCAEVYLATCVLGVFRLSNLGFGGTELRIVLAAGTLWLAHSPIVRIPGLGTYLLFDVSGVVAIAGMAVAFVLSAVKNTRMLYRAEPLPH
ncbi:MAG: CDP-alcohol phosphatidyltransferase family protein [Acidobacteria bacterium]|nr:CDP-alcohol phosphatidyltransferase family protein [Acidobacteriota bacterium]MBI3658335.1 CDP-alcohol phosphatidyltransferase family protein [Acidobacteriota bacterium]